MGLVIYLSTLNIKINVGKYTSPMDPVGIRVLFHLRCTKCFCLPVGILTPETRETPPKILCHDTPFTGLKKQVAT